MAEDFLRECMSDPALVKGQVPIDEFCKAYCVRCIQKDCNRAGMNGSLLARRAATWHKNLFEQPPRAAEGDPKYADIRAKKFLQIAKDVVELRSGGVNYEVQTREMPHFAEVAPKPDPVIIRAPEPAPEPPPQVVAAPVPAPDPAPPPPPPPTPPPVDAKPPRVDAPLQNTPFEQGTVLPGGSQDTVVEVGGTYVFGSDK